MSAHVVLFHALGDLFAVPVAAVREVVRAATRRAVPSGVPWVAGVAYVRGELVPLVDLGLRLARAPGGLDGDLLVLAVDGAVAAVAVERVEGLAELPRVAPPPGGAGDVTAGVAFAGDRVVVVLDPGALMPPSAPTTAPDPDGSLEGPDPFGLEAGPSGPRMVAHGPWTPAMTVAVEEHGVRELVLAEDEGWDGGDVEFLAGLPGVVAIRIAHRALTDVAPIHALGALRSIELDTRARTPIDAGAFPALERCALRWHAGAASLLAHPGLRELAVSHYARVDLRALEALTALETLELRFGALRRLDGIEHLGALRELRLLDLRRLESIDGIQHVPVRTLEVRNCPAVASMAPAAGVGTVLR